MTSVEFDKQAQRLRAAYGPQMHEEFVALLWRRVSDRDARIFEKAVDQIIEERVPLKMSLITETLNAKEKTYVVHQSPPFPTNSDEPVKASELADSIKHRLRLLSGGR